MATLILFVAVVTVSFYVWR